MNLQLKNVIQNKTIIKIYSLCFGYLLWLIFSYQHTVHLTISAPICFYNFTQKIPPLYEPKEVLLTVSCTRSRLSKLITETPSIHINGQLIKHGKNTLPINYENIFLPTHMKLLHYTPMHLTVTTECKGIE